MNLITYLTTYPCEERLKVAAHMRAITTCPRGILTYTDTILMLFEGE